MVNAPPSTSPSPSYTVPPSYTAPPSYSAPPSFTAPSSFDSAVPIIQPFYSPPSGHYGFVVSRSLFEDFFSSIFFQLIPPPSA